MSQHNKNPISNPNCRYIETFNGTLIEQEITVILGFSRLISRRAKTLKQTELPTEITLSLQGGVKVKGSILPSSLVTTKDRFIRFLLLAWNQDVFNMFLVELQSDDSITVEHHQNPRDPTQIHRPQYDAVVHPS